MNTDALQQGYNDGYRGIGHVSGDPDSCVEIAFPENLTGGDKVSYAIGWSRGYRDARRADNITNLIHAGADDGAE